MNFNSQYTNYSAQMPYGQGMPQQGYQVPQQGYVIPQGYVPTNIHLPQNVYAHNAIVMPYAQTNLHQYVPQFMPPVAPPLVQQTAYQFPMQPNSWEQQVFWNRPLPQPHTPMPVTQQPRITAQPVPPPAAAVKQPAAQQQSAPTLKRPQTPELTQYTQYYMPGTVHDGKRSKNEGVIWYNKDGTLWSCGECETSVTPQRRRGRNNILNELCNKCGLAVIKERQAAAKAAKLAAEKRAAEAETRRKLSFSFLLNSDEPKPASN